MVLLAFILLLKGLLIFALILAVSLGIGWALTLFPPFDLFEATLLSLIAGFLLANLLIDLFRGLSAFDAFSNNSLEETD